jgi:hypothetical protein
MVFVLEKYEMVLVKITSPSKNARSKENYPRQWGLQWYYACMYFQVIHCRLRDFFSTGIVCSHRRDVCPWQQICKTHFCRSNPASQCIGSWEHCITLLLALQDVQCNRKAFFVRGYNVIFHRASAGKGLSSSKQTTSNLRMCTLLHATQFVWKML